MIDEHLCDMNIQFPRVEEAEKEGGGGVLWKHRFECRAAEQSSSVFTLIISLIKKGFKCCELQTWTELQRQMYTPRNQV